MSKSETINALTAALAKAQVSFKPIKRTEKVGYDTKSGSKKYNYAPLEVVIDATREALSKNELAIMQTTKLTDIGIILETLLSHSSGEWVSGELYIGKQDAPPQVLGSALTYMRRYAYSAILCISSEEDDDAISASDDKAMSIGSPPTEHWCYEHNTAFFMKGGMKAFAHPIQGTNNWCNEHTKSKTEIIAQAEKDIEELFGDGVAPAKSQQTPGIATPSPVKPEVDSQTEKPSRYDAAWVQETLGIIGWKEQTAKNWISSQIKEAVNTQDTLLRILNRLSAESLTMFINHIQAMRESRGK